METLVLAKNDVEAPASTMPAVRAADRGDAVGMPGDREPIMDRGANSPSFERRIALPLMAGNQQQNPFSRGNCPFQCPVDFDPGAVKAMPVEIERSIGLHAAGTQPAVPASIQRRVTQSFSPFGGRFRT